MFYNYVYEVKKIGKVYKAFTEKKNSVSFSKYAKNFKIHERIWSDVAGVQRRECEGFLSIIHHNVSSS